MIDARRAEIPGKLAFLINQGARYKVVYGGRGGIKSWTFARCLLLIAATWPARILCTRENQSSIAESVHALLVDQIERLGLQASFRVTEKTIYGTNGSEFILRHGLAHNVNNIKSLERVNIAWVEEAQSVTDKSWETLIPTIREEGSEIWVSFNPKLQTDPTYRRFVLEPPPNSIVVKTSYLDNQWLPEVLRVEMETLKQRDYHAYLNVWEGHCASSVVGAVYGDEIKQAEAEGRITQVLPDRLQPVDTFWDLGYGDYTAIWFAQTLSTGQVRLVDYVEDRGQTIDYYVRQLQGRGYAIGTCYLPHDGVDAMTHSRLGGAPMRSPDQLLRAAGLTVRIAPKNLVNSGINATRTVFRNCYFDAHNCEDGIMALRYYQWGPDTRNGIQRREPLHDRWSHGADAFRTLGVSVQYPEPKTHAPAGGRHYGGGQAGWMGL